MKFKNNEIVATAKGDKVTVLDAGVGTKTFSQFSWPSRYHDFFPVLTIKEQFIGHNELPCAIDFDNNYIIVGDYYGKVHLYNRRNNSRKEVRIEFETNLISVQVNQHNRYGDTRVTLNQDYAVSAGGDETIQVYSLAENKTVRTFKHSGWVTCVSFGPVGTNYANKIISCSADKKVRIWKIENGEINMDFQHDGQCVVFDIDKNATKLAVSYRCYPSGGVSVWSIDDKKVLADVKMDSGEYAADVRFNTTADTIAVVSSEGNTYKITL